MNAPKHTQALRDLKMKWPKLDVTVTVRMHDMNPALVDLLWDTLPYRSLQTHALVTGDHLYHLVPAEPLIVSERFSIRGPRLILITGSTLVLNLRSPIEPMSLMARCSYPRFSTWPSSMAE